MSLGGVYGRAVSGTVHPLALSSVYLNNDHYLPVRLALPTFVTHSKRMLPVPRSKNKYL